MAERISLKNSRLRCVTVRRIDGIWFDYFYKGNTALERKISTDLWMFSRKHISKLDWITRKNFEENAKKEKGT